MESIKHFSLTGYKVVYVDLREPKPREQHTDTAVYDSEAITAMQALRLDLTEHIKQRYEKGGYCVLSITKAERVACDVSLSELYTEAVIKEALTGDKKKQF